MLGIMFQKLLSKKWMFFCLLMGSALLVATVVSVPMYRGAVFDRMLRDEFRNYYASTGEWPAKLEKQATSEWKSLDPILRLEESMTDIEMRVGVKTVEEVSFYRSYNTGYLESGRTDAVTSNLGLAFLSDAEEHISIVSGEMYSEDGLAEDGAIEVIMNQEFMLSKNLMLGDTLTMVMLKDEEDKLVRLVITGVYRTEPDAYYWEIGTDYLGEVFLMQEDVFRRFLMRKIDGVYSAITAECCYLFDYEALEVGQVTQVADSIEENQYEGEVCIELLERFLAKQPLISIMLFILQIPVLVLLMAFLLMVSRQMYELEQNEISVIKSRGSSGFQIFRLYLYQNLFVAGAGAAIGIPLGFLFVRGLGSASNFLEFGLRRRLDAVFDGTAAMYLAAAVAATVLIMTLPAIGHSRVSIVHLKQKNTVGKKSWWEKFFLDVLCLAAGIYGFYNYSRNKAILMENVLTGKPLDALLYISSALFIVGMGLLYLRLQPLLVKLIYLAGKRFWHPSSHASFMESMKNGRKQQFIMLFLILTVALGIFYATVARTILQNAWNNVDYLDGVDVRIKEVWEDNAAVVKTYAAHGEELTPRYYEPDFLKYAGLDAASYTKVIYDDTSDDTPSAHAWVKLEDKTVDVTLMGIDTKEFGENTWVDRALLEEHYYTYLNALADEPEGILMSRSFQTQNGCEIGDEIEYCYVSVMGNDDSEIVMQYEMKGKIVGFVDYWPKFEPAYAAIDYSGEMVTGVNYLVVANMAQLQKAFGEMTEPYEIWITLKEGMDSGDVREWIVSNQVRVAKYVNRADDLRQTVEDPMLQGTNGVLTMSFLVMILLCAVGYLIYWVMSIRSRELVFGTLRAFGMHKGELFHMLILEQIFSGALSVLAGIGIGKLASRMYVPMLQMAYAAANQILPLELYTNGEDLLRLYGALALMMVICLLVLILLVFRLNMTKALKLGEE